jgi:conjugal transfer pilus assembly protein TraV
MFLKRISCLLMLSPGFLMMSGCTGMSKHFDCPMKPGVNCKSVSEVNALVDSGVLPAKSCADCSSKNSCSHSDCHTKNQNHSRTQVVWLAPYQLNGIQHSEATVTLPLEDSAMGGSS